MAAITIRDVPDDARDELASRAARSGRSLQEYLRSELIDLARRPDPTELARRIIERKQRTGTKLAASTLVDHLDASRR
jgi:plasmid stability protein